MRRTVNPKRKAAVLGRRAGAGAALAALACLATACTGGGGAAPSDPGAASATPAGSAVSPAASPVASAPPSAASPASAVPSRSAVKAAAAAGASSDGCTDLAVTSAVKAAVTAVYGTIPGQPHLVHIAPQPGGFYYGRCGSTEYAATAFMPTAGATEDEQVAMQDEGAVTKYFTRPAGGSWRYVTSDGFPAAPGGCSAITQIPAALARLWDDCARS